MTKNAVRKFAKLLTFILEDVEEYVKLFSGKDEKGRAEKRHVRIFF